MSLLMMFRPYRWHGKKSAGSEAVDYSQEVFADTENPSEVVELKPQTKPKRAKKTASHRLKEVAPSTRHLVRLSPESAKAESLELSCQIQSEHFGQVSYIAVNSSPMILEGSLTLDMEYLKEIAQVYQVYRNNNKVTIKG